MGNFFIAKEPSEILYFGKSLDTDAEHLRADVNSSLKDLGCNVPGSEGRSVFSAGAGARYTLQGEMRNIVYNINASNKYKIYNKYSTDCQVEVTWKLLNQGRQTVVEQKTTGTSIKFEKGGSAAFEDAFENARYNFLARPEVAALLAKPGAQPAAETKAAPSRYTAPPCPSSAATTGRGRRGGQGRRGHRNYRRPRQRLPDIERWLRGDQRPRSGRRQRGEGAAGRRRVGQGQGGAGKQRHGPGPGQD